MAPAALFILFIAAIQAVAYDVLRNDNVAVYYGQNSYGVGHSDQANWQKRLSYYCNDDAVDSFQLAFLHVYFSVGGAPEINMANTCSSESGVFPGTNLANCQFLAEDIRACQARGKVVTLSLGGATGAAGFTSDAQARTFADTVWNLFLGGSSSTRPFGSAVLDGVDLDIEGGSSVGYVAFINQLKSRANGASKRYYYTAAPQCPFPDAYLSSIMNAVALDAIYVQFYNNYCSLPNFANPNAWNFGVWDNWAKTVAPNRNVKIYIGAPAHPTAATSGYVDINTLSNIVRSTRSMYSSFGGVMLWDMSQAYANNRFDVAIKNVLRNGGGVTSFPPTTTPTTTTTSTTTPTTRPPTTTTTTTRGTGSCSGVSAWSAGTTYVGGNFATYNGRLWYAKWWTLGDTPGGAVGVWEDRGACTSLMATARVSVVASAEAPRITRSGFSGADTLEPVPKKTAEVGVPKATTPAGPGKVDSRKATDRVSRFFRE